MITVLRVVEELASVNYRKWFYSRWSPSDRLVSQVPAPTDPSPLLPPSPGEPGKGPTLYPLESFTTINLVERLRPMLGHLLGNLSVQYKNAVIEQPVDGEKNDPNEERSTRGEKGAKPPWNTSAESRPLHPAREEEPERGATSLDQPLSLDQYASGMLSPHQEDDAGPVIPVDIPKKVGNSQPLETPTEVSRDDSPGETNATQLTTSPHVLSLAFKEDDDTYDADDEDPSTDSSKSLSSEEVKDVTINPGSRAQDIQESYVQTNTVREVTRRVEAMNAHDNSAETGPEFQWVKALRMTEEMQLAKAPQPASNQMSDQQSPQLRADSSSSDSPTSSSSEEDEAPTTKPGPGSKDLHGSQDPQDSAKQKETVREVMQKVEAMMANSEASGSEPQWVQALKMAEAQQTASNHQSVSQTSPVHSEDSFSDSSTSSSSEEEPEDITVGQRCGSQDPTESAQQKKTVGEVMQKVAAMMALDNSGKNGPEPMWMMALKQAEQMIHVPAPQPLPRQQLPPPNNQPTGATMLPRQAYASQLPTQAGQGAAPLAPGLQPIGHERNVHVIGGRDQIVRPVKNTFNALLTPGISGGTIPYAWQPPWFGAPGPTQHACCGLQHTQPQPHPQPNHQHAVLPPTPPPTVRAKRRHMHLPLSPNDTDARKRLKQVSPLSTVPTKGACAPSTPSPLPAESSFIPVLMETEIEDVLTQGAPTCLGSGAYGQVLLKRRKTGGELMALKCLIDVQDHAQAYQDMVAEVRVMMAMKHRPEFPKVVGIVNQTTFAVEFVGDPVTLNSSHLHGIVNNPPSNMTTLAWIQICLDISTGLHALHKAGWSHGDLHTRNIMVWQDPNVNSEENWGAKIIDLGLAGRIDDPPPPYQFSDNEKANCYRFSLHLAPEIVEGTCQPGIISDVYSLGHIFSVVSFNKPKLKVIESIYHDCCGAPKDRPMLQSIIQDLEGFQSDVVKEFKAVKKIRSRLNNLSKLAKSRKVCN